ncbi:hypothetical protein Y032_0657g1244 [Ancylostoma ceylanicum]|uniref:Uncharacterized protein n=1 Tax=Ancylostoma ceylanicum TaxID=53326 RepID=A0A016WHW7_9BILA|nr:hypothetical protein Y032_0657g1244 [Ancylostoma ceylanicum]
MLQYKEGNNDSGNNNNRNGYYSRNNNVGPSQRFNNNAGFENRGNYDTNVRRGNDINANVLPHNNTNVNIASHQRDAPQRSRVLASPQYIPNGPISSTSSSDTEGASPEPEDGVYTDDEIAMEEAAQRAEAANKATDPSKEDDQDDRRSDAQGRLPSNNNPNPHAPFKELDTVYFSAEVDTRLPLYTRPAEARTPKSTPTNENETRLPLNNQPRETRATKSTPTNEKDTRLPLYTQPRETRTTKSTPTNEKDTRLPLYTQPIEARAGKSTPSSEKDTRRPLYTQTENRTAKSTPTNEVHSGDKTLESFGNRGSSGFYSVPLRSRTLNSTNTEVTTGKTDRQPTEILARANKKLDEIAYYSNPFRRDARLSYIPVGREPCSSTNPGEPQPSINYPLRDLTQLPMQDLINIRMCTPTPQELPDPTTIFGDVFSAPTDAPTDAVENVQEAENNFGVPVSNRRNQVLEECLCGVPENSDQRRQKQQTSDVHRADSDAFKPR